MCAVTRVACHLPLGLLLFFPCLLERFPGGSFEAREGAGELAQWYKRLPEARELGDPGKAGERLRRKEEVMFTIKPLPGQGSCKRMCSSTAPSHRVVPLNHNHLREEKTDGGGPLDMLLLAS